MMGEDKSTGSNGSRIPSTAALSTKINDALMGNKDQDDPNDSAKKKMRNGLLQTRPRIWRKMPRMKN